MNIDKIKFIEDIICQNFGLVFSGSYEKFFRNKVNERIKALNLSSIEEYCNYLSNGTKKREELLKLVDAVVIKESYFFREKIQFDILFDYLIPKIKKDFSKLKIWSAGCADGAEPYTITIYSMERGEYNNIEIIGTDISFSALKKAKIGIYTEYDLRNTPEYIKNKYFRKKDGNYLIIDEVKNKVKFKYLNLLDIERGDFEKDFNIIFCRNVFIYFDNKAKEKIIYNFYKSLISKGYLFISHSESFPNNHLFKKNQIGQVYFLQKE